VTRRRPALRHVNRVSFTPGSRGPHDGLCQARDNFTKAQKLLESVAATGSTISVMKEKPGVVGVTGGAVGLSALALAFGVCCVAPWAVTLLGVAGAVLLARLAFIQPYIVAATIVLLGVGFWFVYRRPRAAVACDVAQRRRLRWVVWGGAVVVIAIDIASFAPRILI
jgi:mercuric ion transport protein